MTGIFAMKKWCFLVFLTSSRQVTHCDANVDGTVCWGTVKNAARGTWMARGLHRKWHQNGRWKDKCHRYHPYFWGIEPLMILEVSSKFKEWIFSAMGQLPTIWLGKSVPSSQDNPTKLDWLLGCMVATFFNSFWSGGYHSFGMWCSSHGYCQELLEGSFRYYLVGIRLYVVACPCKQSIHHNYPLLN
jgi:hypothetical protein